MKRKPSWLVDFCIKPPPKTGDFKVARLRKSGRAGPGRAGKFFFIAATAPAVGLWIF
jgi:hypothetical protein